MVDFYVIQSGKPVRLSGEINGDCAEVMLPFGGYRRFKWPHWFADLDAAQKALEARQAARVERARKVLERAGKAVE